MRRYFKLSMLCLAVGAASACSTPETVIATENIPTAGVRFINAVPDTNAMDMRFVDIVESNAHYKVGFRNAPSTSANVTAATQVQFKNARAGSRHFRIFLSDTLQAVATVVLKDTTVNLEAGKLYTALMWGNARAGNMKLVFYEEVIPDPGTAVALRVINATNNSYEVRTLTATGAVPAAPTWTVAPLTRSSFVTTTTSQTRFNYQPVGGGAIVCCYSKTVPNTTPPTPPPLENPLALIGQAATIDLEGTPGTTQAGSAITAIIFPPSVAGSKATQFTTPNVVGTTMDAIYIWDRRPPRPGTT